MTDIFTTGIIYRYFQLIDKNNIFKYIVCSTYCNE